MNITSLNYTIKLFGRIFNEKNATVPFLNGIERKYRSKNIAIEQPFDVALPEEENVPSENIRRFLEHVISDSSLDLQNFLIFRNGKLLFKTSVGAWDINTAKATFSACKSITSLAIGILYDEGKLSLSEEIADIFRDKIPMLSRMKMKGITIHHLLTMTSTVRFNEAEAMTHNDWTKAFFDSATVGKVGQSFNYNSLNTYMLAAIVCKKSGMSMTDFLEEKLFSPLGIRDVFWEKAPNGIEKGGWGLYIRPEDMAKIGQLVLQGGKWKGKRIISQRYLNRALKPHSAPTKEYGNYDYGYQIWLSRDYDCFLFNGMFGQNVFGFRNSGVLVLVNCANGELFQQSRLYRYINEYFGDDFSEKLQPNEAEYQKLLKFAEKISNPFRVSGFSMKKRTSKFVSECTYINGKSYVAAGNNSLSTGLLPLAVQIIQNNYTKGIKEVKFELLDGKLFVKYIENNATHVFPVGFDAPERFELEFDGENYKIASTGSFYFDENLVLKIRLDFLETPFTRFLRFVFYPDKIVLMQSENPGHVFLNEQFDVLSSSLLSKAVPNGFAEKIDKSYVFYKIERTFAPKTVLSLKKEKRKSIK